MALTDPVTHLLAHQPPGSAIWSPISGDPSELKCPAILARIEPGEGKRIPKDATVEHRAGSFLVDGNAVKAFRAEVEKVKNSTEKATTKRAKLKDMVKAL